MAERTLPVEVLALSLWRRSFTLQRSFDRIANFFVFGDSYDRIMTLQHAARISVDHEYRLMARVKEDGIRGLRADTFLCEQFRAQLLGWSREH